MDSNTFPTSVGVGEREGRLYGGVEGLVGQRYYGMTHGIGRSGDISALQPKAAGSSLLSRLVHQMTLHLLRDLGVRSTQSVLVMPLATGMALLMTFLTLRARKPAATHVLWSRIDQKTCLKSILSAGLTPIIIENRMEGDEVRTDVEQFRRHIEELGADKILCIFSTTSTFTPRVPDRVVELAGLAKEYGLGHVINNAYGVQQSKCMHLVEEATRKGHVDCYIQSTDKNFMVPVGGSIIASAHADFIQKVSANYPGRASASPLMDLFIQYLSFGYTGYQQLLKDRQARFVEFKEKLQVVAEQFGERVLDTPHNQISIGMTLDGFGDHPTEIGGMLFRHFCSGVRVIARGSVKKIGEHEFPEYGAHINGYPHHYMTVAAAIGMQEEEIDTFLDRLSTTLRAYRKKLQKRQAASDEAQKD